MQPLLRSLVSRGRSFISGRTVCGVSVYNIKEWDGVQDTFIKNQKRKFMACSFRFTESRLSAPHIIVSESLPKLAQWIVSEICAREISIVSCVIVRKILNASD